MRKIILLFFLFFCQTIENKAQSPLAQKADSLFSNKNYSESAILYQNLIESHDINKGLAYLKLAYIHENQGDFSRAIYYLNQYLLFNPAGKVFDKINQIAEDNSFSGYSRSDFNFFNLLMRQNSFWIFISILVMIIYGFLVIVYKRTHNHPIPLTHKLSLLLAICLGLLIINFPSFLKSGIINKRIAYVREAPSSGAAVIDSLREGSKVNFIGEKDIWLKLYQGGEIKYIKKSDLWIIGEKTL